MTAEIIQVDYESLENISKLFQQLQNDNEAMAQKITSSVEQLQSGGWEGKGSAAFFAEMSDEVFPALDRLTNSFETARSTTSAIIATFQTAEEEAANQFEITANGSGASGNEPSGSGGGWGFGVPDFIEEGFDRIVEEGRDFVDDIEDGLSQAKDTLVDGFNSVVDKAEELGRDAVVEAFKAGYGHDLPREMIDHYANGNGAPLNLNETDAAQLGVDANIRQSPEFEALYNELVANGGGTMSIDINSASVASTHGTLGRFNIDYTGELTVNPDGTWSFDGDMEFRDVYDFNPAPWGERSTYGEILTRVGDQYLPGQPFDITTDPISVSQSSSDSEAQWAGTDIDGTPSRLANEIRPPETEKSKESGAESSERSRASGG